MTGAIYRFGWPLLWLVVLLIGANLARAQSNQVLVLEAEGPVTPAMASYFERGIAAAEAEGAAAVVIVLDTPGGRVDFTLSIVKVFQAARVPVIIYVAPEGAQAASAGSVLTVAAHAAGMAPGTIIGAASPVGEGGVDIGETAYRKAVEDLKATMRSLVSHRGEEAVALAEAMIEDARAVTATEALEVGLIDVVASDVSDLLRQVDGLAVEVAGDTIRLQTAGTEQQRLPMSPVERILHGLVDSVVIGILLTIGVQAILIEISSPGGWVAGFIGAVCLGLGLYGLGVLPVNWLGLAFIGAAFVLFLLEVKAATHGALAAVGTVTMLAGLLILFNSPGTPEFARISIPAAVAISLATAGFFVFLVTMALRARQRPPITGAERMIGLIGQVRSPLEAGDSASKPYSGMVLVNGELWRATADEPVAKGEKVVVKSLDGFTLRVKRVENES
ncbi:MAG: nodulation protein NfeD [Chloroflexi bacterium]|nr:nodulation protein NfeD [Chloroflexota bacterium]MCI0575860.1 nodulation protein NfeD [Chloroflexota bacterium]MCI0646587.1 nodulation protein NfeD [Chloroflexota bacterium]MCI0726389.1 nodulation protein NfeD [Chloroflexota bacterium]